MPLELALADIRPGRFQPRQNFDEEKLLGLAQSIRDQGLINPIIVFENEDKEYELIAGERRWRASCALALSNKGELQMSLSEAVKIVCRSEPKKLGRDYFFLVACYIKAEVVAHDLEDLTRLHQISIVDNIQRDDLSPVEVGQALLDLKQEYGYSIRQLAGVVNQSKSWVEDRLKIASLTPEVAQMVGGNGSGPELDITLARELARKIPANLQPPIAEHVRAEYAAGKPVKELAKLVGDIARFIDPNRWSLSNDFNLPHNPVVYNRARLLLTLLANTPPGQLARGLLQLKGDDGSYYARNYLTMKVATVLNSSYEFSKIVQKLTGKSDPWPELAAANGWTCDRCILKSLVDVIDLRDDGLDHNAPCQKMVSRTPEQVTTCPRFIGPEDAAAIVVSSSIHSYLDETSGSNLLKRPLNGENACYVTSWQDYAFVYNQARIRRAQQDQEQEERQNTQHLKPIARYWQAQLNGSLGTFSQIDIHHFQAHACRNCKHFTAQGLGQKEAAPCRFAEHPLKQSYGEGTRAPRFGLLNHPDGFSVPRCEKFQRRSLPDNIRPVEGVQIGKANRALVLNWFHLLKKQVSTHYEAHRLIFGVLTWLHERDLEKLWDEVNDDGVMMAILQTGVHEIQSLKSWGAPVRLLDPTTGENAAWTACQWPTETEE